MKRLFFIAVFFFFPLFADLQNSLTGAVEETMPQVNTTQTKNIDYASLAREIQFWIFIFIGVISVAYILYIGAKLLWAPGSTEEITVAMKSLAYIIVGLALIPFAYFIIQFLINIRL